MDIIGRGIIAGFLATLALSAALDPLLTALRMANVLPPAFAWILHFFVGSFIWGAGFAALQPLMRGPYWLRGFVFGILAWLLVMIAFMACARTGLFGARPGLGALALMLLAHVIYGGLLGTIFGLLDPRDTTARSTHLPEQKHNDLLRPLPR